MRKATVGFRVEGRAPWPALPDRQPWPGETVAILPGTVLPASHPIVLMHGGYFEEAEGPRLVADTAITTKACGRGSLRSSLLG